MRLLTYNIHKGIGGRDRKYRLQRIVDVIEIENPDLICLQEVDRGVARSRYDDQPGLLVDAFKSAGHLFQPNVHLRTGVYGNLVLSRWPLHSKHQISLRLNVKKVRGAQLAVVETPEGLLHIVHVHLGLGERERHWQVEHLLGHHRFQESAHLPTMIVGDFERLAQYAVRRNAWAARVPPVDGARFAISHISGLAAAGIARQSVRPRAIFCASGTSYSFQTGAQRLGPSSPGGRLPSRFPASQFVG